MGKLNNRARDIFEPLYKIAAVADCGEGTWLSKLNNAASLQMKTSRGPSDEKQLLQDIRYLFDTRQNKNEPYQASTLASDLAGRPHGLWKTYGQNGRELSPKGLANLLENYEIASVAKNTGNFYLRSSFEDWWMRLGIGSALHEASQEAPEGREPPEGQRVGV